MRYLIAYDISQDSVRARTAAMLAVWGDRIQWSVFECSLTTDELGDLLQRIEQLVDARHDSIHVVPICQNCDGGRRLIGQALKPPDDGFWVL